MRRHCKPERVAGSLQAIRLTIVTLAQVGNFEVVDGMGYTLVVNISDAGRHHTASTLIVAGYRNDMGDVHRHSVMIALDIA